MIVALTGFMGCGKSSVASILSEKLGCFYFDLDDTIQMEEGRTIPEIFEEEGEGGFRALEVEYLGRIISDYEDWGMTMVLSLGGGTIMTPACAQMIKDNATCIYLRASVDELVHNLEIVGVENRPLLSGETDLRAKVEKMMSERSDVYEAAANIVLDIDGLSFEEVADKIVENL